MKKKWLFILMLGLILVLLCACGEGILPPAETETPAPMPTPLPTPTPAPYVGEILALEINQALSYGVDAQSGELYDLERLAARRDTAVFVRLSQALGHAPDERDYLELTRDGEPVGRYLPSELSTEDSLCFLISGEDAAALTAGTYSFRAVVDDAALTRDFTLTDTRPLRVLLVPILGNFHGSTAYPAAGWQDYLWHLSACWPLANDGLAAVTAPGLDLSGEDYDLTRSAGLWAAWEALWEQAGVLGEYDLVIGFVSGMMAEGGNCGSFGRDGVVLINAEQTAPEAAITHFAAQTLGAGDEYEGGLLNPVSNPAPYGVAGLDAAGETVVSQARGVAAAADRGLFCSGSAVGAEQVPFDLRRARLLGDAASFMGGAGEFTDNYWISSDLWNYLFDVLAAPAADAEPAALPEDTAYVARVSGLVGRDGSLTLGSLTTAAAGGEDLSPGAETGDYRLVFVDGNGTALRRFWFDLQFLTPTDGPTEQAWAPFDFLLPVPAGAAGLLVYGPALDEAGEPVSGQLLGRASLSAGDPYSFFTNLETGQRCAGITRVEWKTEDEDSGASEMYYELYFTAGDTQLLVYRGRTAAAEVDMLSLPDAERFHFLLLTSDGGRSTTSLSPELVLAAE